MQTNATFGKNVLNKSLGIKILCSNYKTLRILRKDMLNANVVSTLRTR